MKAHLMAFAISAILVASIGMTPVFGQVQSAISVATDKLSYSDGDIILVTGDVREKYSGIPVTIRITAPNGNVVRVAQLDITDDKKFSLEQPAGGGLMKTTGTYTVEVQYGSENRSAITSFDFVASTTPVTPPVDVVNRNPRVTDTTVSVEGASELIRYTITGGKILDIVPDVDSNSLIVSIDATEDGSLTLTIPRSVLDAKVTDSEDDDDFIVLVDLEDVDFDETTSSTDRTLTIEFSAGTEEIEIIGTWVIPEFGTIAAMILAVAIISIIAISAKSKLSIIPRY